MKKRDAGVLRKDCGTNARQMQSSKYVKRKARTCVMTLDIHGASETVAFLDHARYRYRAPLKT